MAGININKSRPERDKRRVWLDEKDCERLTRTEFNSLLELMSVVNSAAHLSDDLSKRLECIPSGKNRMRMALGCIRAIADDIVGTITRQQANQIQGVFKDYEIRYLPKMTPSKTNIVLTKEIGEALINCAKAKCNMCAETGVTCRKCELYKILEAVTPIDDYGNDLVCPYLRMEFVK